MEGLWVGFGGKNRPNLAQRRPAEDEGSDARASACAVRRSTMSWWEAASATDCAV